MPLTPHQKKLFNRRIAPYPLLLAAYHNDIDRIDKLVKIIHVNSMNYCGQTAFFIACERGHLEAAKALHKQGANVSATSNMGFAPVHAAAMGGHLDILQYLHKECGCNVDLSTNDGHTPLTMAIMYGHLEVVKFLKGTGCIDFSKSTIFEETYVHIAAGRGHLRILEYLHKKCECDVYAKSNKSQWTAAHFAAENGMVEIINYLSTCGCDLTCTCEDSEELLFVADETVEIPTGLNLLEIAQFNRSQCEYE